MSIILNGTTGITTPTETATTSVTAPLLTSPASTALTIQSAGTTAMTVDTSQNVGIGYVPTTTIERLNISASSNSNIGFNTNSTYTNWQTAKIGAVDTGASYRGSLAFYTNPGPNATTATVERMRIDDSGNLLVGTTSQIDSTNTARLNLLLNSSLENAIITRNTATSAGKYWRVGYVNSINTWHLLNQSSSGVYITDGATSWTGTSDERMKTDLKPIEDATNKVATLRAVTGRYLYDEEGISRSFLIAQDVQKILPEAVNVQSDEQGTLGLAYTDVIPLLVAAIKELSAKNDALEARLAALEAK